MNRSHQDPIARLRAADPAAARAIVPPIAPLLARLDAPPASPDRRPRGTLTVRVGVATIVAVAAVAVGLLAVTGGGGGRLDVVAQARAALSPSGTVLHLVTRSGAVNPDGSLSRVAIVGDGSRRIGRLSVRREQWSTADPSRYRTVQHVLPHHGSPGGTIEEDYADGVARVATSWTKTVRVRHVSRAERATMARVVRLLQGTVAGVDPVQRVRAMLRRGALKPAGTRKLRGRQLRRLVGQDPGDRKRRVSPTSVEYLVDPKTSVPVQLTTSMRVLSVAGNQPHRHPMFVQRTVFERYERLPLNAATRKLLRIDVRGRKIVPGLASRAKRLMPRSGSRRSDASGKGAD